MLMQTIRYFNTIFRHLPAISCVRHNSTLCDKNDFVPIYKFPYIRAVGLVNRLKLYHTSFTSFAISSSMLFWQLNAVNGEIVYITTVLGLAGCAMFYSLGFFTNKVIGFLYLNKNESIVRVAYIDFWGRRKDLNIPLNDVIPLSELPSSFMDVYYKKFKQFSTGETLKINTTLGQIIDKEKFNKVFAIH